VEAITATYKVTYAGKDITADISASVISISYTDNVEGESDELVLEIEDTTGKWREAWYPDQGATLTATMEYGGASLDCGTFEIDMIEFMGPPGTVTVRALAAGVKKAMRTKRSRAYEDVTLSDIASRIAAAYSLTVEGTVRPVKIKRATQHRKQDLRFLTELALEYGYSFSVRGTRLVFTSLDSIEAGAAVFQVTPGDVTSYSFRDQIVGTYAGAAVAWHNPETNEAITGTEEAPASIGFKIPGVNLNLLEIRTKAEDSTQAKEKAAAALREANTKKVTAALSMPADPRLCSGINVGLSGFGAKLSGKFHILRATHTINRGNGYTTDIEAKKI